jgi:DNA polymerase elongation subunit (family B)
MKILMLDIETSPNTAHIWGLFDQNVSINQLLESSYVLCWAAKWLGEDTIYWQRSYGNGGRSRVGMLRAIHKLLDQADALVHYNGTRFDIPTLNKEFLLHGMTRPSPSKEIDLLRVTRNQFKFTSNKLDYVVRALNLGEKVKHRGHELWLGCMNNDPDCWKEMETYNRHDVVILEKLYYRLLPWIKNHANYSVYHSGQVCPNCGSLKYHRRGYATCRTGRYQRFQCQDCGSWYRGTKGITRAGEQTVSL